MAQAPESIPKRVVGTDGLGRPIRETDLSARLAFYTRRSPQCWLWVGSTNPKGYGRLHIRGRGAQLVHRLVWELRVGEIPPGLLVCHTCDNPPCVRYIASVRIARCSSSASADTG